MKATYTVCKFCISIIQTKRKINDKEKTEKKRGTTNSNNLSVIKFSGRKKKYNNTDKKNKEIIGRKTATFIWWVI